MLFFTSRLCRVLAPLVLLLSIKQAQAVTAAEMPYVGNYTGGTVDTISQVFLLADNTFCAASSGGSLDMLVGGRWQADTGGRGGVRLKEVRRDRPAFPAVSDMTPEPKPNVKFAFLGRLLSHARTPVFGISATDAPPATLRPLFATDINTWANRYQLPPMNQANVQNFYVGQVEFDANDVPVRVKVTQYALKDANLVVVGFDKAQGRPMMDLSAVLNEGWLRINHQDYQKLETWSDKRIEQVRSSCIRPAFPPEAETSPEQAQRGNSDDGASSKRRPTINRRGPLVPVKSFYMEASTVQGAAYFGGDEVRKQDHGEDKIKSE